MKKPAPTVTLKHVAERAGVSPKTVSRVINGEQHVRAEVREAVLQVVAELNYRPNAFARSLSSSRSFLLGLFFDDPASGYAADVQLGALVQSREHGYHLVVERLERSEGWITAFSRELRALHLEGVILTPPVCDWAELLDLLDEQGVPYVRIAPGSAPERSGAVWIDDRAAAYEMTQHLLALGHRDIAFVQGNPTHSAATNRWEGFRAAMADAGVPVRAERVYTGDFTFRAGLAAGEQLLAGDDLPSAVFASNDDMALGILVNAMKRGIAVPERLSICGFDDAPIARASWPPLTTVRQPNRDMAAAAVELLADRARTGQRVELSYALVPRASTGAVPGAA